MRFAILFLSFALLAACGREAAAPALHCHAPDTMTAFVRIEGGPVDRGAIAFQREERVGGDGAVAAFSIDTHEVTNRDFAAFVAATGYVTRAERAEPDGAPFGAAVFDPRAHQWRIDRHADWRHPSGANSSIEGRDFYPVVQIAYEDAQAYAHWRGRRLPTELEWERAARGDAPAPDDLLAEAQTHDGGARANIWHGIFPILDQPEDGFAGLAPVGCYAPNQAGLYDMIGNVWEWTSDWYAEDAAPASEAQARASDPNGIAERVIKGGSFLCSRDFCARFRSGARQPADPMQGMSHIGFRTVGPP